LKEKKMSEDQAIVEITGEPYLSRALAYKAEYEAAAQVWSAFSKKHGASGFNYQGLTFDQPPPTGWTKPSGLHKISRPKKNTDAATEMANLPRPPQGWSVFPTNEIPYVYSYEAPEDIRGSSTVGFFFFGGHVGWTSKGRFICAIPHVAREIAAHKEIYPNATYGEGQEKWRVPDGLREISKAEADLIFAQDRFEQEQTTLTAKEGTR
jgi:hypothetical protein